MKTARMILKIVGAGLSVAGLVCLVLGFWENLTALVPKKKRAAEFEDYADAEE